MSCSSITIALTAFFRLGCVSCSTVLTIDQVAIIYTGVHAVCGAFVEPRLVKASTE